MPDDPTPGQEPIETPAEEPSQTPAPGQEPTETPKPDDKFDAEYVRKLRSEAAANRKRAADAEAKLQEHENAKLSEQEKLAKRAEDAEKKAQDAAARIKAITLRATVERHAHKLNIVDEDAAFRLLDLEQVQYEDDEPKNVEQLLKELVKAKPYLVAPEPKTGVPATPNAANGKQLSQAEDAANRQAFSRQVQRMFR